MRLLLIPILFLLIAHKASSQSVKSKVEGIRGTYKECIEYYNEYEPSFIVDLSGEGGGFVYKFYSNGKRLYLVEQSGGYEDGGQKELRYFFNEYNKISFIYAKHFNWNYYDGESEYKEERFYVSNNILIKYLVKQLKDKDPSKIKDFIKEIDNVANTELTNTDKHLINQAEFLLATWNNVEKLNTP